MRRHDGGPALCQCRDAAFRDARRLTGIAAYHGGEEVVLVVHPDGDVVHGADQGRDGDALRACAQQLVDEPRPQPPITRTTKGIRRKAKRQRSPRGCEQKANRLQSQVISRNDLVELARVCNVGHAQWLAGVFHDLVYQLRTWRRPAKVVLVDKRPNGVDGVDLQLCGHHTGFVACIVPQDGFLDGCVVAEGAQYASDNLAPHGFLERVLMRQLVFWSLGRHRRLTPLQHLGPIFLRKKKSVGARPKIAGAVSVGGDSICKLLLDGCRWWEGSVSSCS